MDEAAPAGIRIAPELEAFLAAEALPGTGITPAQFWTGYARLLDKFAPRNRALLVRRNELQAQIDAWHHTHRS
jgi:malate synthase